jgi:nucleoside-diphosphate-sugar epimerase
MSLFRFVQGIFEGRAITVFGDGTQSRDFTFVDDIARGTIAGLQPLGFEIFNLGSDEPVVLRDAMQMAEELIGKEAVIEHRPRHPADVPATWADVNKARRMLGWQPETRFVDGMRRLVEWYHANRDWAREIMTGET